MYRSILTNLGIALLLLIVLGPLFILFPYSLPHPEDFSPTVYLIAFALGSLALLKNRSNFWLHLVIPLIALFGFLEEISWGAENDMLHSNYLYWEAHDLKVRDVHNLLPTVFRALRSSLGMRQWSSEFFAKEYQLFLLGLPVVCLASVWLLRHFIKTHPRHDKKHAINQVFLALSALLPPIFLAKLFAVPVDPKNILFIGLSTYRLLVGLWFIVIQILFLYSLYTLSHKNALQPITRKFGDWIVRHSNHILAASWIAVILGILYQATASLGLFAAQLPLFQRINPVAIWTSYQAMLCILALSAWHGYFPHPESAWPNPLRSLAAFLQKNPAFVYTMVAVSIVLFAQMIDRGWITFNYLIHTPHFWVPNWEMIIEETLEMLGGFLLATAAFFVWRTAPTKP